MCYLEVRAPATGRSPPGVWWQLAVSMGHEDGCLPGQYLEENLKVNFNHEGAWIKETSPPSDLIPSEAGGWNSHLTQLCFLAPLSSWGADEKRVGLGRLVRSDF